MKIAVAAPAYPQSLTHALEQAETLIKEAAEKGAAVVCFPETYLPGYPSEEYGKRICSEQELNDAFKQVCSFAARHSIAVVMPMDWYISGKLSNIAYVISKSGEALGYQTKNQLDPSEDNIWHPGTERNLFEVDGLKFGISICHEGFRYPETIRWAARQGAHLVFHPNYTGSDQTGILPNEWAQKDGLYYEKAQMVRALENTIFFAPCNYAFMYPESASSVIAPDGSCLGYQDYGKAGVFVTDIDLSQASGLLAKRLKADLYKTEVASSRSI